MDKKQADDLKAERQAFRHTFFRDAESIGVLAWILNETGHWRTDASRINPELVAFANHLLLMLGIVHPLNIYEIADKLQDAANDIDLNSPEEGQ